MNSELDNFLYYLAFSTFVMFFFFGFLQLNHRRKHKVNFYLSGLFFSGGYQFFYYWAYGTGLLGHLPFLLNTEIAVCFLIGPFLYSYFRIITGSRDKKISLTAIHFLPFGLSLLLITGLTLFQPILIKQYVAEGALFPDYADNPWIRGINICCDLSMAAYFILALIKSRIFLKAGKLTTEMRIVLIFLMLITINVLLLVFANLIAHQSLMISATLGYALLPMYYVFFSYRHPEFCLKVIKETKTIRYEQAIIKKLDLAEVEARLKEIMEEDKFFVNSDLSLNSLSENLKIKPYQLSRILNDRMGVNFNTYVNAFRIEEAKRLLIEWPEKSVLEIAFSVGFNSKSSFNTFFQKEAGVSPTAFRKTSPAV